MDDDKVVELARTKQSIIDRIEAPLEDQERRGNGLHRGGEALPAFEKLSPLPGPGDAYVAHARVANKAVPTFHCVFANGGVRGFSNALLELIDLAPDGPGKGMVIKAVFGGTGGSLELILMGRNLNILYTYVSHRRMWWVREIIPNRDFFDSDETVITRITVRQIEAFE